MIHYYSPAAHAGAMRGVFFLFFISDACTTMPNRVKKTGNQKARIHPNVRSYVSDRMNTVLRASVSAALPNVLDEVSLLDTMVDISIAIDDASAVRLPDEAAVDAERLHDALAADATTDARLQAEEAATAEDQV